MTVNALLYPSSGGVPTWQTEMLGEKLMMKLPVQFRALLSKPMPLSEDIGAQLAAWAEGTKSSEFEGMAQKIANAASPADLEALVPALANLKDKKLVPPVEYRALREAYAERLKTLEDYARANADEDDPNPQHDPETGEVIEPNFATA